MVAAPFAPPPERTSATVGLCFLILSMRCCILATKAWSDSLRPNVDEVGSVTPRLSWAPAENAAASKENNIRKKALFILFRVYRPEGRRLRRYLLRGKRGW